MYVCMYADKCKRRLLNRLHLAGVCSVTNTRMTSERGRKKYWPRGIREEIKKYVQSTDVRLPSFPCLNIIVTRRRGDQ